MEDIVKKIGIIGDGKMGFDIFMYLADYNFSLVLLCKEEDKKEEIKKKFNKKIKRLFDSGILDINNYNNKIENVFITTEAKYLRDCNLIIEAIFENIEEKSSLFVSLDKIVNKECIFCSNSSSIIPSKICPVGEREDKFIGLHFFYPLKMKKFVEIIITSKTNFKIFNTIKNFLFKINKEYIKLEESNPFILNRAFLEFQAEAFRIIEEKIVTYRELDLIVKENIFPIGIFELIDSVGIDTMYSAITQYIQKEEQIEFYKPLLITLKNYIDNGKLGLKNGKGFFSDYSNDTCKEQLKIIDNEYKENILYRLLFLYINSVYKIIEKEICSEEDIEYFIKEYMDIEKGPIELSKEIGFNKIYQFLNEKYIKYGFSAYCPSKLVKI